MRKITKAGNMLIRIVTGVLSAVFLLYGVLMLWDMFRTEMKAFASYDLLQFRPDIEENEPPYLDDLIEINKDTAAWITMYGTNIDYPVMQGKDDNDYLNRDVYGEYSISGSVFMASQNAKDFSDPYTLVYGHHMANGSMFGDIVKYKDEDFFSKNTKGVLILPDKVYNLRVMACFETDAYDHNIYWCGKSQEETDEFVEYVKAKSKLLRECDYEKIITLSTCNDATSWGRTILVCAAKIRTTPLPDREEEDPPVHREAAGHPMAGTYWALLNLICVIATLYSAGKLILLRKKIGDISTFIEAGLTAASMILFFITEDMHKPIQLVDAWTLPMILILAGILLTERLRGRA